MRYYALAMREPDLETDEIARRMNASSKTARRARAALLSAGWIEIGGAGMVHPDVLRESGYDPDAVSGWAFGVGIERIAMVRQEVDDIRVLFENDPRVLEQLA